MTLTASLTDAQVDRILGALERAGRRLGILPGAEQVAAERKAG